MAVSWITPVAIYDKCGEYFAQLAEYTIDELVLESEWAHYVTEYHWIVFDLGLTREVRGIRIYQGATSLWGRALGLYVYVSDDPADWGAAVWGGTLNFPL